MSDTVPEEHDMATVLRSMFGAAFNSTVAYGVEPTSKNAHQLALDLDPVMQALDKLFRLDESVLLRTHDVHFLASRQSTWFSEMCHNYSGGTAGLSRMTSRMLSIHGQLHRGKVIDHVDLEYLQKRLSHLDGLIHEYLGFFDQLDQYLELRSIEEPEERRQGAEQTEDAFYELEIGFDIPRAVITISELLVYINFVSERKRRFWFVDPHGQYTGILDAPVRPPTSLKSEAYSISAGMIKIFELIPEIADCFVSALYLELEVDDPEDWDIAEETIEQLAQEIFGSSWVLICLDKATEDWEEEQDTQAGGDEN